MTVITLLAHAGHDHTYVVGGESHHYLWLAAAVGVAAVAFSAWALRRRAEK